MDIRTDTFLHLTHRELTQLINDGAAQNVQLLAVLPGWDTYEFRLYTTFDYEGFVIFSVNNAMGGTDRAIWSSIDSNYEEATREMIDLWEQDLTLQKLSNPPSLSELGSITRN